MPTALERERRHSASCMQVLMSARASARQRKLDLTCLVVDEVLVLRAAYHNKRVVFRAKGGVNMPRSARSHVFVRLREVPGACMKTEVTRPWWERRYKHHRARKHSSSRLQTRSQVLQLSAPADGTAPGAA